VRKRTIVRLAELAIGKPLPEWIKEKTKAMVKHKEMCEELNKLIADMPYEKILKEGVLEVKEGNIRRWCNLYGIKSLIREKFLKGKRG